MWCLLIILLHFNNDKLRVYALEVAEKSLKWGVLCVMIVLVSCVISVRMYAGKILILAVAEILPEVADRIILMDASIDAWVPPVSVPRDQKAFGFCNCHSFRLSRNYLLLNTMQLVVSNYPPLEIITTTAMADQGVGGNTLSVAARCRWRHTNVQHDS